MGSGNETGADQFVRQLIGNAFGIFDVALAARHNQGQEPPGPIGAEPVQVNKTVGGCN